MPIKHYTEADRDVALAFLESTGRNFTKAARKANVPERLLQFWASGGGLDPLAILLEAGTTGRPKPPADLMDVLNPFPLFVPDTTLETWIRSTFIDQDGALYNADHEHLADARIGFLWTNVGQMKQMRTVAGQCAIPRAQGGKWAQAMFECQLIQWFGAVPDFLITLYAPFAGSCPDSNFCALVEHEMYHAAQVVDEFGSPKFRKSGEPVFGIKDHDVSQFLGVKARYGSQTDQEREWDRLASRIPTIAAVEIEMACGTCGSLVTA